MITIRWFLVDLKGFEPTTLRMRTVRSPKLTLNITDKILQFLLWYDMIHDCKTITEER